MDIKTLNKLAVALDDAGYQIHEISVEPCPCGKRDGEAAHHKAGDIRLRISPKPKPDFGKVTPPATRAEANQPAKTEKEA